MKHVDVLIVGAGLSGIGAACHLRRECPGKTFAILESRGAIGGTWDLFRYPGIRSDSDMFTLGYSFRPWTDPKTLADGESIRNYVVDTAREYGVEESILFSHKVVGAEWSSADARWTVQAQNVATGESVELTCSFLFANSGYYRYDEGYTPDFAGVDTFAGQIVHPQHWPEDLDYTGKKVVVIGSGATAITLVPAMAEKAGHVTMLQRSPTYIVTVPAVDWLAEKLHGILPQSMAYPILRWKNIGLLVFSYQFSRKAPKLARSAIRKAMKLQLPKGYDVDKHFNPSYNPWDQRLCVVPDADLFKAIRSGRASVATDRIAAFTPTGLRLESGAEIEADIVVTATGLNLLPAGGMTLSVDGEPVQLGDTVAYKGMMLSGVPNFALTIGYTNASWTLKADLVSEYVCRLLNHLDATGQDTATPQPPGPDQPLAPMVDLQSGYVLRSVGAMPKQGTVPPWKLRQNYARDMVLMRRSSVEDEGMRFSRSTGTAPRATAVASNGPTAAPASNGSTVAPTAGEKTPA